MEQEWEGGMLREAEVRTKVIICISPVQGGVGPFLTGVPAPRLLACSLGKKSLLTEKHCVILLWIGFIV